MKTTTAAFVLLCAAGLAAPAADTTVDKVFDGQLSGVEREIVPLVKEMPDAAFSFVPKEGAFQKSRTFAAQAKHVAAVLYVVSAATLGEKVPIDPGPNEEGPDTIKSKAQVIEFLNNAFVYAHKAMKSLNAQNQLNMVKSPFGQGEMPRLGIANIAITHTFDHYGQMVIYARMNNVVPPASR